MMPTQSRFLRDNTTQPVALWSMDRHRQIGRLADQLLGADMRQRVRETLEPGGSTTLAEVAAWADLIKDPTPPDDPETKAFLANPANRESHGRWHFLNLPFGTERYDRTLLAPFIPADGAHVVEMCLQCARAVVTPTSRLSRTNGLRWLTHLVGDLHQPMHLGCGFLDESSEPPTLVGDPRAAAKLPHDRGGNNLLLPPPFDPGANLHAYWDGTLSSVTMADIQDAAKYVTPPYLPSLEALEPEIASWVADTLLVSKDAYAGIRIIERDPRDRRRMRVTFDDGLEAYETRNEPHVARQMAKAAVRLTATVSMLLSM